jgi:hypothetical protein
MNQPNTSNEPDLGLGRTMRRLLANLPEGCSVSFHRTSNDESVELLCTEVQRQQLTNSKMRVYVRRQEDGRLKATKVTVMEPGLGAKGEQKTAQASTPNTKRDNKKEKAPKTHRRKNRSDRRSP